MTISSYLTGVVLSTETVSSFESGAYLEWAVSGNVLITITNLAASPFGVSALLNGLFFDAVSTVTPGTSAPFIKQDTTTSGNWIGTYGTQSYDMTGDAASIPSYATVTMAG